MEEKTKVTNEVTDRDELVMRDEYEMVTKTEDELLQEVARMEDHSRWFPGILSKDLEISPVPDRISVPEIVANTGMPLNLVMDTAIGAKLYVTLPNGDIFCVRETGKTTLFERAGIFGSALGRENPEDLSATLNMALRVATGSSLLLLRDGKVSAFHSDAGSGYRIIPISELLKITSKELNDKFGTPVFLDGFNSHSYTKAIWMLPDVKDEICYKYEQTLKNSPAAGRWDLEDMTPAVRLTSSDTATSAVALQPLFMTQNGTFIRLVDGIRVKHIRASEGKKDGLELFEELITNELFAKFTAGADAMKELSGIEIWHADNVVVGLCNKFRIPKKYGDRAREQVCQFMAGSACLTACDVFLALSEALSGALENGMGEMAYLTFEEKLYSTMTPGFDWAALDVGGVVAWGNAIPNS